MTTGISVKFESQGQERVCIVGCEGMLGRCLMSRYSGRIDPVFSYTHQQLDITDELAVRQMIRTVQPKVVINATGYTNVDGCESDFERAMTVNAEGPANLAKACEKFNCLLVHVSSDYVFSGDSKVPYEEGDDARPINAYGESKLLGEHLIRVYHPDNHIIVRTSWLFAPHGRNFVKTIYDLSKEKTELKVVDDQRGRPTYAPDLATSIEILEKSGELGTYHFANEGECSWFELAREVVSIANTNCTVIPVRSDEFPRPAKRPKYSVLSTDKFALAARLTVRFWQDALRDCIKQWE